MKKYMKSIIASFLVILACLGFGRFSFGMILPNLQESLYLSSTQAGLIGTSNFIGYFVGIFFANYLYKTFATHRLIFATILLQAFFMFLMTHTNNYQVIAFFYSLSGFFSAISNIAIMAYIASVIPKEIRGKALGIIVGASGLAIVLTGQIVPFTEDIVANMPWKTAWTIFCVILVVVSFIAKAGIKKHASHTSSGSLNFKTKEFITNSVFWKIAFIYIVFGFTYSIYVTFFVSTVMEKYTLSTHISGNFWTLLGFMSIFSGFLFGIFADKVGAYKTLIVAYSLQAIAHGSLAFEFPSFIIWLSVILFGISVWSIPSLVILLCSLEFHRDKTSKVFSLVTILFASFQALGPFVAGITHDLTSDYSNIFLITSLLAMSTVFISFVFSKQKVKQ
ncbi:MAG: YbfB/YjiJ family MFS transporter [Campylobacterota bacterium]